MRHHQLLCPRNIPSPCSVCSGPCRRASAQPRSSRQMELQTFFPRSHGTPALWSEIQARESGAAVYLLLSHKSMKSFTVDLKAAWLENQARLSFFTTFGLCNPI